MKRFLPSLALALACGGSPTQTTETPRSAEPAADPMVEESPPVVEPVVEAVATEEPWTIDEPLVLDTPTFARASSVPQSADASALLDFRPRLRAFQSSAQLRRLANQQRHRRGRSAGSTMAAGSLSGLGGLSAAAGGGAGAARSAPAATSSSASGDAGSTTGVTTTQIAGIDEGDIVKAMGEHFLVLRQGILYTVQVGAELAVKDRVEVVPEDQDGWIDELLVHAGTRRAVVVGFVEAENATYTVLHLFDVDDQGAIERGDAIWLRSEDYFDDENYATRLVGDDLVLYSIHSLTPEDVFSPEDFEGMPADEIATMREQNRWDATLPALRNERGRFQPTWAPRRIFVRAGHVARTLQAVTRCDLSRTPVPCTTHGVLENGYARLFVSDTAAYLWVEELALVPAPGPDAPDAAWERYDQAMEDAEGTALIYRFPHRRSRVEVATARGSLSSMMHLAELDGKLHALVGWDSSDDPDDPVDDVNAVESDAALLSFDLRRFTQPLRHSDVRRLPSGTPEAGRFLGARVVYGSGGEAFVHDVRTRESWVSDLGSEPVRVDPLLGGMLVTVASDGVEYVTVELGDQPTIRERRQLVGASGSETRTHGFFFLPSSAGNGTFGVPIVHGAGRDSRGEAAIAFFDMANFGTTLAGALRSEGHEVECRTSCYDWYGNTRPLFWQGRIYALMGSELVEGQREGGSIVEQRRVLLEPPPIEENTED